MLTLLVALAYSLPPVLKAQEKHKVIVDADSGNEVDDVYAIVRLLVDPEIEALTLLSK